MKFSEEKKGFSDIPQRFVSNDKILSGSLEIAEGFNEYFVNIGPNLAKSIPLSNNISLNSLAIHVMKILFLLI